MPFTPTHVLAVIPIFYGSRKLSLLALAVGSVIPDFPLFYPISTYTFSHTPLGIIVYCIPMAMMLYLFIETLGKLFFLDISPIWLRSRLAHCYGVTAMWRVTELSWLFVAFALGSATHIVWDAFTHQGDWGVELFPILTESYSLFGFSVPYYKLIQHGSSLVGLPALCALCLFSIRRLKPKNCTQKVYYSNTNIILIGVSFLAVPCLIFFFLWQGGIHDTHALFGYTIKYSMGTCILLYFWYALFHWLRNYRSLNCF